MSASTNAQDVAVRIDNAQRQIEKMEAELRGKISGYMEDRPPSPSVARATPMPTLPPAWDDMRSRLDVLYTNIDSLQDVINRIRM